MTSYFSCGHIVKTRCAQPNPATLTWWTSFQGCLFFCALESCFVPRQTWDKLYHQKRVQPVKRLEHLCTPATESILVPNHLACQSHTEHRAAVYGEGDWKQFFIIPDQQASSNLTQARRTLANLHLHHPGHEPPNMKTQRKIIYGAFELSWSLLIIVNVSEMNVDKNIEILL